MASLFDQRRDQIFPVFTPAQIEIARKFASASARTYAPHEFLYEFGERHAPAFLILRGCVDVVRRDAGGHEGVLTTHRTGQITGEISQLAGRAALTEGRAGSEGCEALAFDAAHLRALLIGSAELGELIMRAYILRRTALITEGGAGSVLVGRDTDPWLLRLEGFLRRNSYPYTILDPSRDAEAQALIERLSLPDNELPIVVCPNGAILKRPTEAQVGSCLGMTPDLDPQMIYDVAVVGAGPAGLATAVYGASEGLSMLVLDSRAFGGQAGASARIENYLGFPTGISGQALAGRAYTQATKFGAEIAIPVEVSSLDCGGERRGPRDPFILTLESGQKVRSRSIVVASGARYRRPAIPDLERFEASGVSYWASPVEAKLCEGTEVALVGAGNSAGQAVVYLAPRVRRLTLVVRGPGLEESMSRYLVDRIAALPNVDLHCRTEIVELNGAAESGLQSATFQQRDNGKLWRRELHHVFLFIGADPNTAWLRECGVDVDAKGFVVTGGPGGEVSWQQVERAPLPLETNIPGVFAIGDVRAGSTKRVAAAVGEGAQVVASLHQILHPAGA